MEGKRLVSSVEKEKIWTEEGDLYAVRTVTESRGLRDIARSARKLVGKTEVLTRLAKLPSSSNAKVS